MIEIDVDYNTDSRILTVEIAADCCTEYCREYCRLLQVVGRLQIEIYINTDRIEYTRNIRIVQSEFNRMKLMRIHNRTEQNRVEIQVGVEEQINGVALVLKKLTSSSAQSPLNMIGVCQHHHLRDTGQSMQEQVGIERRNRGGKRNDTADADYCRLQQRLLQITVEIDVDYRRHRQITVQITMMSRGIEQQMSRGIDEQRDR